MPLVPGLHEIELGTRLGTGYGLLVMEDGEVHGGDATFAYVGRDREEGEKFSIDVASRHRPAPAITSLFGTDDAKVHPEGDSSASIIDLEGRAAETPGFTFKAVLFHSSD